MNKIQIDKISALVSKALARLQAKDFDLAEKLLKDAIKINPDNAATNLAIATLHNGTKRFESAKDLLLDIIESFNTPVILIKGRKSASKSLPPPASVSAVYAQLGFAYHNLGSKEEALEAYKKAQELFYTQDIENLIKSLSTPVLTPKQILLAESNMLLKNNRANEAIYMAQKALEKFPDDAEFLHIFGMSLRALGRIDEALPYIQQAIILNPDEAIYYNDLGMVFYDKSDFNKAVTFYKKALSKNPNYYIAYSNMGVAYKKLEKVHEAIEAYSMAIQIKPDFAAAYNNLGNLLRVIGNIEDAKKYLYKALELNPNYEDAKINLEQLNNLSII